MITEIKNRNTAFFRTFDEFVGPMSLPTPATIDDFLDMRNYSYSMTFFSELARLAGETNYTVVNELGDQGPNIIDKAIDTLLGVLLYPLKLLILVAGKIFELIVNGIGNIGGNAPEGLISLDNILFNHVPITKLDFFNFNSGNDNIDNIRGTVAQWYYALRNLSIIISLCVLIYTGVRMAISSIAEDKAKYKQMLINWVVGFLLIFILQYIIIITISATNSIVEAIAKASRI